MRTHNDLSVGIRILLNELDYISIGIPRGNKAGTNAIFHKIKQWDNVGMI